MTIKNTMEATAVTTRTIVSSLGDNRGVRAPWATQRRSDGKVRSPANFNSLPIMRDEPLLISTIVSLDCKVKFNNVSVTTNAGSGVDEGP